MVEDELARRERCFYIRGSLCMFLYDKEKGSRNKDFGLTGETVLHDERAISEEKGKDRKVRQAEAWEHWLL